MAKSSTILAFIPVFTQVEHVQEGAVTVEQYPDAEAFLVALAAKEPLLFRLKIAEHIEEFIRTQFEKAKKESYENSKEG